HSSARGSRATCDGPLGLRARLRGLGFVRTRTAQDAAHGVVALVAGVLVDVLRGRVPGVFAAPGLFPARGILHRELVEEGAQAGPGEALRALEGVAGSGHGAPGPEVRGLDDQGVALPPADRVPEPLANLRRDVLRTDADHARVVHHLVEDQHVVP